MAERIKTLSNMAINDQEHSLTARTSWLLLAKTLGYIFSFALPLMLVRWLNQAEFGLYKQVFLIVGSTILILPLGFHMSAYYYLPRETHRRGQVVFNILLFYMITIGAVCLVILLRPSVLAKILGGQELPTYAGLISLVVLTWGCSSFLETVALANQEIKLAAIFIVTFNLSRAVFMIGAVVMFDSFKALLYASAFHGGLQLLTLLIYVRVRFGRFWREFDWALLRAQLSYALPLGIAATILHFQVDLDKFFVSKQLGAAALAVYSIGCFNIPLFFLISDAVGSVMIPRVTSLEKLGERREIVMLLARMIRKLSAIALPLYALLLIVGPDFIVVLFTTTYIASWPIFAVNLAQIPLSVLTSAYDPVLRAYAGQRYFLLSVRILLLSLQGVALWYGTKAFGMLGAVSIVIGIGIIERIVVSVRVSRLLGLTRRDLPLLKDVGKVLIAVSLASCVTLLTRRLVSGSGSLFALTVCSTVFSVCYALALLLLGVLTPQERTIIRQSLGMLRRSVFGPREQDFLAGG